MTTFAGGGMHGLSYVRESVFGVTPTTPQMLRLRHTSCSLGLSKDSFQSSELRSDAQIADLRHGTRKASGDVGIELSYGAFDDLLAALVRGTWTDNVLTAGVTIPSFTLERTFGDIGQYEVFTGCLVNSLSLNIAPNAMVTGTLGFVGRDVAFSATPLDASVADVGTAAPLDGFSGALQEGGVTIAVVTGLTINADNGMNPVFVLGSGAAAAIPAGRINISGTLSAYFENMTLLNKFIQETESNLEILLGDGLRQSYRLTLPRIKYSGGENSVSGEDPIQLSMPFQALLDPATGTNIRLERIPGTI